MIKKEEIEKLAELCRITLSQDEIKALENDFESILAYVSDIHNVSGEGGEPEVGALYNVMREDGEPHESGIYTDSLLREMPDTEDGYLKVKKIL